MNKTVAPEKRAVESGASSEDAGKATPVSHAELTDSAMTGPGREVGLRSAAMAGIADLGRTVAWAAVGIGALTLLWFLVALRSPDLPRPLEAWHQLVKLGSRPFYDNGPNDKGIGRQLFISLTRVFAGFGMAAVVGIPLGMLIGASKRAWMAMNPIVQMLRPVSPLAWFPIWLVVFRDSGRAAIIVIFITALWPTVINTAAGVAAVPHDHRNVAKVFQFGRLTYVRHVMIPNTLPSIVTGLRLSMGIAWMVIVAVEMLSSGGSGIGFFIWDSYNVSNTAAVIAAIVFVGATGFILDSGFLWLARRVAIEEVQR